MSLLPGTQQLHKSFLEKSRMPGGKGAQAQDEIGDLVPSHRPQAPPHGEGQNVPPLSFSLLLPRHLFFFFLLLQQTLIHSAAAKEAIEQTRKRVDGKRQRSQQNRKDRILEGRNRKEKGRKRLLALMKEQPRGEVLWVLPRGGTPMIAWHGMQD